MPHPSHPRCRTDVGIKNLKYSAIDAVFPCQIPLFEKKIENIFTFFGIFLADVDFFL